MAVSKTSKKKGQRCPYKKKLNNSFLTHLHYYYYIEIIKYNKRFEF